MKTIQFQTTYSSPEIDSTDLRIYEFMELAVNFLGLDRSQRLEIKPATNCNYNAEDSIFLKENLLLVPEEELAKRGNMYAISYPSKCLTTADIEYMLAQKKRNSSFQLDSRKLNFTTSKSQNWYEISVPLFSID